MYVVADVTFVPKYFVTFQLVFYLRCCERVNNMIFVVPKVRNSRDACPEIYD